MAKKILLISLILALALVLWAPWLTPAAAQNRAEEAFIVDWLGVVDGCGLNCKGCGARDARRTWLGYQVKIEFVCGLQPEDAPQYHEERSVFVSILGTVHGFPEP